MDRPLTVDEIMMAERERWQHPGFMWCQRCFRPHPVTTWHTTMYGTSSGMSPLCVPCYSMLTPEERLPYYKKLWIYWFKDYHPCDVPWEVIRAACLHEADPLPVPSPEMGMAMMRSCPSAWRGMYWDGERNQHILVPNLPEEVQKEWDEWFLTRGNKNGT